MATFFNSATGQYEDDGRALPPANPSLTIPIGRGVSPNGQQDIQIPLGISPNNQRQEMASKDLAMDMQANPGKYPFGNSFTVDTSPETIAAYKQSQQGSSSDRMTGMPGVSKSDLVGMSGQQQQQTGQIKPSDINKLIGPSIAGYKDMLGATNQMMQAAAMQGVAHQTAYEEIGKANDQINKDYFEKSEAAKQRYQDQANKVAEVANKVSEAAQINPNRFWADKGTGEKIAAAISIGLGALGGALQGTGKNAALDIMDRAVDRDIMAQEKALMQNKDSLAVQQSLLGMYHQQVGDMDAARSLAKADAIQSIQYGLNAQMAGVQSKEALAKAQMMQGELKNAQGQYIAAAQQRLAQLSQQQNMYSGQGDINPVSVPKEDRDLLVNVGGRNMMARSPGAATEVREKVTSIDSYQQQGRELIKLLDEKSTLGAKFPTELNERIKTISGNMAVVYGKSNGMGAYDKGTEQAIATIQGDPSSFMKGNNMAKIKESLHLQEINKQNILKANVFGYKGIK